MNENKMSAKLTCAMLFLDKAILLIDEIKQGIGSTPTQIDLICAEVPFSINYSTDKEKSNVGQINGSYGIKEIDNV